MVQFDDAIQSSIRSVQQPPVGTIAKWTFKTADAQWPLLACALVVGIGWATRRASLYRAGIILLLSCALSGLVTGSLRGVVGRTRPRNTIEQGWFGPYHNGQWLIGKSDYNSFPSGHTGTAAGLAFAAVLVSRRYGWILVLWALGVAWARIYVNAHHPSDTIASMAIALFIVFPVRDWVDRFLIRHSPRSILASR